MDDHVRCTDHVGLLRGRPGEGWHAAAPTRSLTTHDTIDDAVVALPDTTGN